MNEHALLQTKRENFHLEIRRKNLEQMFNLKRTTQKGDQAIIQQYEQDVLNVDHRPLQEVLSKLNHGLQKPIIEMVSNKLGAMLIETFLKTSTIGNWELWVQVLQYINSLVSLEQQYLHTYLEQNSSIQWISQCFIDLVGLIDKEQLVIQGCGEDMGQSLTTRLSHSYLMMQSILIYVVSDCKVERAKLLENAQFFQALYKTFQIKMDSEVLLQNLKLLASLLVDLHDSDYKCLKNASAIISPMCQALMTPNKQKLLQILLILLSLAKVGIQYNYINNIFKFNGGIRLVKLMGSLQDYPQGEQMVLKVIGEICYQSTAHIQILIENGLLTYLPHKIASNHIKVQIQALWVLETLVQGTHQFCDQLFENHNLIDLTTQILGSSDAYLRSQACFTLSAILSQANMNQVKRLCDIGLQNRLIEFMQQECEEELSKAILEAIINVLNQEAWYGEQYRFLCEDRRQQLKTLLCKFEVPQGMFTLCNSVLSIL